MIARGVLAVCLLMGVTLAVPVVAQAAPAPGARGAISVARLDTFQHRITVVGWAYDQTAPAKTITVHLESQGRVIGTVRAGRPSPRLDARKDITGRHTFRLSARWPKGARWVAASSAGVSGSSRVLNRRPVRHVQPPPGTRIVTIAKRYVGKARYVEGGASPKTGFDCSGYTQYVYAQAGVRRLPHNAEAQRQMRDMRRISVHRARPGDLVFYMNGSGAFHVAIYAGHHMQYAAATAKDGIRYQAVWSRYVQYGTDWH